MLEGERITKNWHNTFVKRGSEEAVDVNVTDVEKCFDALWAQECINTWFEYGLTKDKLVVLHEENKNAMVAIKTATLITSKEDICGLKCLGK